jgi:capsid protein
MGNLFDKVISYFSPVVGLKRAQARAAMNVLRKYEAASVTTRMSGWNPAGTSADYEIGNALVNLRNRVRDLCRNNEYAKKARNSIASYMVGAGIIPKARGGDERAKRLNELWRCWGETIDCDFDGHNNFYGLQTVVSNAIVESGACLAKRVMSRPTEKNPIGLEIQILEPDFICLDQAISNLAAEYIKQV